MIYLALKEKALEKCEVNYSEYLGEMWACISH